MGLIRRNKSGRLIGGSKLNVPGQGVYTVVRQPNDKLIIGPKIEPPYVAPEPTPKQKDKLPITPTPTPTITPTITPTPSITPTHTPTTTPTPTTTITPSITPTHTPTITPTPTPTSTPFEICYLSTEDLNPIIAENGDNLIVDCPTPTPTPTPTNTPTQTPQNIINAILIDGGSGYLIPETNEYLIYIDP